MTKENTCCFIGHRKTEETENLKLQLKAVIENLITAENVDTFLFGSKSQFNSICYELVTEIKEKFPHIKRVYVRAEYPYIDNYYTEYLLEKYEYTYYPERALNSGKAVYIERNCEMIDKSKFCVIYFDKRIFPKRRKSGTEIAYNYAVKQNKLIIRLPFDENCP